MYYITRNVDSDDRNLVDFNVVTGLIYIVTCILQSLHIRNNRTP